ncbi:MAG: tetratricopeptide repeat protein [Myxococcales bacterium]|nr:tetratricopeptide repeat protein [Myxococcales bacterium]
MTAQSWQALETEAAALLARGEVGRAAHLLIAAIELAPDEARLYQQLVRVALLAGGTQTAVSAALELRRLDAGNPQYAYLHAVASLAHGDVDGAQGVLEQALTLAPHSWEVRQALAQTCRIKKDDARALALLGEAVRLAPTSPGPVNDYAVLLLEGGRAAEARVALERAAHEHPADAGVQLNLALACAKLRDATAARRHAQQAQASEDAGVREQASRILAQLDVQ